jgi:hypothetical protein
VVLVSVRVRVLGQLPVAEQPPAVAEQDRVHPGLADVDEIEATNFGIPFMRSAYPLRQSRQARPAAKCSGVTRTGRSASAPKNAVTRDQAGLVVEEPDLPSAAVEFAPTAGVLHDAVERHESRDRHLAHVQSMFGIDEIRSKNGG